MAHRLYNGISLFLFEKTCLLQFGKEFKARTKEPLHLTYTELLDEASEDDNFIYWCSCYVFPS